MRREFAHHECSAPEHHPHPATCSATPSHPTFVQKALPIHDTLLSRARMTVCYSIQTPWQYRCCTLSRPRVEIMEAIYQTPMAILPGFQKSTIFSRLDLAAEPLARGRLTLTSLTTTSCPSEGLAELQAKYPVWRTQSKGRLVRPIGTDTVIGNLSCASMAQGISSMVMIVTPTSSRSSECWIALPATNVSDHPPCRQTCLMLTFIADHYYQRERQIHPLQVLAWPLTPSAPQPA